MHGKPGTAQSGVTGFIEILFNVSCVAIDKETAYISIDFFGPEFCALSDRRTLVPLLA